LPDGKLVDAGKHVLDALGRDPEGIAYSSALYIPMFLNRVPRQPMDAAVRAFLRYVLSREGQAAVCPKSEDTCR